MKIISRRDALAAGLTRYFTGKPCQNGHVAERYASGGGCVICSMEHNQRPERKERQREYWQKPEHKKRRREYQQKLEYKERARGYRQVYRQKPEVEERVREYRQEYWQRPEVKKRVRLNRYHKNGTIPTRPMPEFCEVRGCIPDKRGLVIEHCHKTNKFRGWVCNNCNTGIGMLGDTVEGLMHAVEYLRRAGG